MNAPTQPQTEVLEREVGTGLEVGTLAVLSRAEIDMQVATAHRFPRSITSFLGEAISMVSMDAEIAEECIYALPRDGKTIEGPSARFAEIIVSAWGNSRAGARVVDDQGEFVTAQGVFHDLQKNVAVTYEVKRRIVNREGRRFSADMIGVTANAACSIALRNAVLKGVPKAFWKQVYDKARATIMGDFETLPNRRAAAIKEFSKFGVTPEKIFAKLEVKGEDDITLEHIVVLRGMVTALRDGDSTPEEMFAEQKAPQTGGDRSASAALRGATGADKDKKTDKKAKKADKPKDDAPPAAAAKQGDPGTPEMKAQFLQAFKTCKDKDVLGIKRDEVNFYKWSLEDVEEIDNAYKTRLKELAG